jgi:hypothetical protein
MCPGRSRGLCRAGVLRFTPEEAAALLGEAAGPGLPGAAVAALVARTEGWAAGLQLAGLSLRGHADAAGFAAAFSGSHRFVLDCAPCSRGCAVMPPSRPATTGRPWPSWARTTG